MVDGNFPLPCLYEIQDGINVVFSKTKDSGQMIRNHTVFHFVC